MIRKFVYSIIGFSLLGGIFTGNQPASAQTSYQYDVVVVGGEPEGVAATVSAARNGAKTLLVEPRDGLGGLITYGKLNYLDLVRDSRGNFVDTGIFSEWFKKTGVKRVTADVETAKQTFEELVTKEKNATLSLNSSVKKIIKNGTKITGIVISTPTGEKTITAKRFIDTTAHADFAAQAGVPYFRGRQDIGLKNEMAVTLMIHLKDVNWDRIKTVGINNAKLGKAYIGEDYVYGWNNIPNYYKPSQSGMRLRGLNVAKNKDGTIYINALQVLGVDGLNEYSKKTAIDKAKRETPKVLDFLKKNITGFENAKIMDYPTELYIRETRHIYSEYQLPVSDIWENKSQWDQIAQGGYPVDIQAPQQNEGDTILTGNQLYAIPFRSIVPLKVDNLLVASKASGYSSLAAGSTRVIPTGMSVAEAAGAAAKVSIDNNVTFREMSKNMKLINTLQRTIQSKGLKLMKTSNTYSYKGHWNYPAIKSLMKYGLVAGGYKNDLEINKYITEKEFVWLMENSLIRANYPLFQKKSPVLYRIKQGVTNRVLTKDKAAYYTNIVYGTLISNKAKNDPMIKKYAPKNKNLIRAEAYQWLASIPPYK